MSAAPPNPARSGRFDRATDLVFNVPGRGRDAVTLTVPNIPGRQPILHTYWPKAHGPDDPVVLVQHGIKRNGDEYRDFWIEAAERHRLFIVATTFPADAFPETENYNNGRILDEHGSLRDRSEWIYALPARVFRAIRAKGLTRRKRAHLFGHSAGGQFVHRLMATESHRDLEAVIAANSGWYTLPTLERPFPDGIGGLDLDRESLARWFAYPFAILAGDRDSDPDDPNLPRHPAAMEQGPMRFARAKFFHQFAHAEAKRLGLACRWTFTAVPGVAHDGEAMSHAAAALWFGVK
jgi:poly(3-hydroxybutyrate) depolymerase